MFVHLTIYDIPASLLTDFCKAMVQPNYLDGVGGAIKDLMRKVVNEKRQTVSANRKLRSPCDRLGQDPEQSSRKHYLSTKRTLLIRMFIPRHTEKFHEALKPFLDKKLDRCQAGKRCCGHLFVHT